MSNNNIAVSSSTPSYSGSDDCSAPTAAQTNALHKAASATSATLTSSVPTGTASGAALVIDTPVSATASMNTESLDQSSPLQSAIEEFSELPESLSDLYDMPSMDSDEVQTRMTSISSGIDESLAAASAGTSSTSEATSTSDTTSTSTTSSTSDTSSTTSTSSTSSNTTTDDTTSTSGTVSMTQIMDELAGLDISISNDAEAQNTALIDSINCMTSAAIKAGDDTIKAGNSLVQGAFASFMITAGCTALTMSATGSATAEANETADSEAAEHTNTSVTESEKATAATQKALDTGNPEDMAAAKQANANAKAANSRLPDSSAVKQQNQETITANENAIKAKEAENAAAKQKAATTPQAPADAAATNADGRGAFTDTEANTAAPDQAHQATATTADTESAAQLKAAKESLAKSNTLLDGKASLSASRQATAATERYMKNPSEENYQAACDAQSRAEGANAKLASSPLKEANNDTLMANQKAINQTKAAHTGPDGKPLQSGTVNQDSQTAASKSLAEAKASQAKAAQVAPKNVYVRNRLTSSQAAMQTLQTAMQKNMIFNQLGEQASNLTNVAFQTQSKVYEGEGQIQQATSSAYNEAITETNTSMQSLYSLAGDLRSSSSSVAQDMESMVNSTRA